MDITALRQSMASQISSVVPAPLSAYWYQPDMVTVPAFYIRPPKLLQYDRTMRNTTEQMTMEIVVLVSRADDLAGQLALDPYLHYASDYSIKAALEAGRVQYGGAGFAGGCEDLWVSQVDGYQHYALGDTTYLGATFTVEIIGDGTA
jgi:hypothetical protein